MSQSGSKLGGAAPSEATAETDDLPPGADVAETTAAAADPAAPPTSRRPSKKRRVRYASRIKPLPPRLKTSAPQFRQRVTYEHHGGTVSTLLITYFFSTKKQATRIFAPVGDLITHVWAGQELRERARKNFRAKCGMRLSECPPIELSTLPRLFKDISARAGQDELKQYNWLGLLRAVVGTLRTATRQQVADLEKNLDTHQTLLDGLPGDDEELES